MPFEKLQILLNDMYPGSKTMYSGKCFWIYNYTSLKKKCFGIKEQKKSQKAML